MTGLYLAVLAVYYATVCLYMNNEAQTAVLNRYFPEESESEKGRFSGDEFVFLLKKAAVRRKRRGISGNSFRKWRIRFLRIWAFR